MSMLPWIGVVAALYASVGHGGASGYLAVLALFGKSTQAMTSTALMLNLVVASTAWKVFKQAGHARSQLLWPFALGSIPAAAIGSWLTVSPGIYRGLLAFALAAAALRLGLMAYQPQARTALPKPGWAVLVGAAIGFISGVVGVGGGIFLSPIMLLARWAYVKQIAAASAGFIALNSLAALAGRFAAGRLTVELSLPLLVVALAGGFCGAQLGANRLPHPVPRMILVAVLLIAAGKLGLIHG